MAATPMAMRLASDQPARKPSAIEQGGLTVRGALESDALAGGSPEVLAGQDSLDRPVRWVHAAEVPNIAALLRGGELLLTTGIGLDRTERGLIRLVSDLADRGLSGLIIELGPAFARLPRSLVATAERHQLPVIALHRETSFAEVCESLNQELLGHRMQLVEKLDSLQQACVAALVDGDGVPEVLSELTKAVANPAVLERDGKLLYHAPYEASSGAVIAAWDAIQSGLPTPPKFVATPLSDDHSGGTLVVIGLDRPIDEATLPSMERVAGLVGLVTMQTRQEEILVARQRGNLLMSLLEENLSETEISRQVHAVGFPPRVAYRLVCVVAGTGTDATPQPDAWTMIWREVRRELESRAIPVLGGLMPGERNIAFVVGLPSDKQRSTRANELAELFAVALERQFGSRDAGRLFVGEASRTWTAAARGLAEVVQVAEAPHGAGKGWHDATNPDLERLFWGLRNNAELRAFVDRRLGPVIAYDEKRGSQLLLTLEAFVASGGSKTQTAKALHLKRQSVYDRLERIEGLLNSSLNDQDTWLGVQLGLRARRFAGRSVSGAR